MTDETRTYVTRIDATPDELVAWHQRPGAFERLSPPWAAVDVVSERGGIAPGDGKDLHIQLAGPIGVDWSIVHESSPNVPGFTDRQTRGPFAKWTHEHRFVADGADGSLLEDRLTYRLPGGVVGAKAGGTRVAHELDRVFTLRQRRTRTDFRRGHRFPQDRPLRILISGGSGLVGSRLRPYLLTQGHEVMRLTRDGQAAPDAIAWDPQTGTIEPDALEGFDAVIHLGGVSIAGGRWTERRKEAIRASRVEGTSLLATTLAGLERKPGVFVSTSAVGYYGDAGTTPLTESSPRGEGFLADVCEVWESAADPARAAGIRVVHPRFGVVFAGEGGLLPLIARAFKAGVGGPLGSGDQYLSWVSLDDLVGILLECVVNGSLSGPVNASAPQPVTNREFSRALGTVLHRPSFFKVPSQVARLAGGQLADELILASQRVEPEVLTGEHFPFAQGTVEGALRHELGRFLPGDVPLVTA